MNLVREFKDNFYFVGVNDRETDIFEALWPLPQGVSYNSYLIDDEQVALVDTVKIDYCEEYLDNIREIIGDRKIDFLIINHMEPDHSGSVSELLNVYPDMEIIGNKKTMGFLEGFYGITDNTRVVDAGDTLDLGEYTLEFHLTPMIHWPETMMTYEKKEKILFSGDAFGSFGTLNGGVFDDEVNLDDFREETGRYYTNIVARYSPLVSKTIDRFSDLEIKVIAPTHGPVWRDNPGYIVNYYKQLSEQKTEDGAAIVYGSMYGNTKKMAERIAASLSREGIKDIKVYDVSRTDVSYLINDIWRYRAVILGACTYNTKLFPPMQYLLAALENRNLKNNLLGIFGSYSWSGGAVDRLKEFAEASQLELVEPVIEAEYSPGEDAFTDCDRLGKKIAKNM